MGTLDRRLKQSSLPIHTTHANTRLDILVENTGRVNFGHQFPHERAGITREVTLSGTALSDWKIYPLPMQNTASLAYKAEPCAGACFYRAHFQVQAPADTFVDMRSMGKGEVFINGQALGRFWDIGPQGTLYLPAPWLKQGENEIVVFDLDGKSNPDVPFLAQAVLDSGRK